MAAAPAAGAAATLGWHVDRWAQQIAATGAGLTVRPARGAGLAAACRDASTALPGALVALARRLPEGELASLEARLLRSLARAGS